MWFIHGSDCRRHRRREAARGFLFHLIYPMEISLDEKSGVISGTPKTIAPIVNYTLRAWNGLGKAEATFFCGSMLRRRRPSA